MNRISMSVRKCSTVKENGVRQKLYPFVRQHQRKILAYWNAVEIASSLEAKRLFNRFQIALNKLFRITKQ